MINIDENKSVQKTDINWEITTYEKLPIKDYK